MFLGVSSILAWDQASQLGKRPKNRKSGEKGSFPLPSPLLDSLYSLIFLCRFTSFFAIFPHSRAWSCEVAWVSGLPKGVRERGWLWLWLTPTHVMTSYSLNHIITIQLTLTLKMTTTQSGCRNVSHCQQQQSYSGLRSPGRSNSTYFSYYYN